MKQHRMRKLSLSDREKIRSMASARKELGLTYLLIGKMFNVSKGRISQIVNDNYNESTYLTIETEE